MREALDALIQLAAYRHSTPGDQKSALDEIFILPDERRNFVLHSGTPKSYVKTAESGNKRRHAFCGDCGTPIYACAVDNPQSYALRVGTITQRAAFSPRRQSWRRSALHWVDTLSAVPATETG